eukprot:m.114796 g.114796  ORF g.114796 m.114796 type:complete len:70 (+) comp22950_c0_seq2:838-1047(+)
MHCYTKTNLTLSQQFMCHIVKIDILNKLLERKQRKKKNSENLANKTQKFGGKEAKTMRSQVRKEISQRT